MKLIYNRHEHDHGDEDSVVETIDMIDRVHARSDRNTNKFMSRVIDPRELEGMVVAMCGELVPASRAVPSCIVVVVTCTYCAQLARTELT